jgi:hypothetical protein
LLGRAGGWSLFESRGGGGGEEEEEEEVEVGTSVKREKDLLYCQKRPTILSTKEEEVEVGTSVKRELS